MPWVTAPVHSNAFSLSVLDVTAYNPGEWHTIEIASETYEASFRGLMIYAEDSLGRKVGQFSLPKDSSKPSLFWKPPGCQNAGGDVVMHMSADVKPMESRIRWKAPAKGTGTVTFRALLKQGEANLGSFHWPNQAPLSIAENENPTDGVAWIHSLVGQSCDQACMAAGGQCDGVATGVTGRRAFAASGVARHFNCKEPVIASCLAHAPAKDSEEHGRCWHRAASCGDGGRPFLSSEAAAVCSASSYSSEHGRRLCACSGIVSDDGFNSTGNVGTSVDDGSKILESSASSPSSSIRLFFPWLVSAALLWADRRLFMGSFVLLLLLLVQPVAGHNWLYGRTRAGGVASTTRPAKPFKEIHYQLNAGQSIPMEIATGHSHHSFLIVLHESDFGKLNDWVPGECLFNGAGNCEAPGLAEEIRESFSNPGANKNLDPFRRRYHRGADPAEDPPESPCLSGDDEYCSPERFNDIAPRFRSFGENLEFPEMSPDDPHYIIRDSFFTLDITRNNEPYIDGQGLQYRYLDSALERDIIYDGADGTFVGHEWVESFYEFFGNRHHPFHSDVIMVNVPAKKGPGHYIVFYNFGGYFDVCDIEILEAPVEEPNGSSMDENGVEQYVYNQVDHCTFTEPRVTGQCFNVVDRASLQQCFDDCDSMGIDECWGVNVVPVTTPQSARFPQQSHAPWASPNCDISQFPANGLICYAVKPKSIMGDGVTEFEVSSDPSDSVFYGTCFTKDLDNGFGAVPASSVSPPWYWNGECIACEQWLANQDRSNVPRWDILVDGDCFDCVNDPPPNVVAQTASPAPPPEPTPAVCNPAAVEEIADHFIQNTANIWEGDDNMLSGTYEECFQKCCDEPTCVAFVRSDDNNECWFKNAVCPEEWRRPANSVRVVVLSERTTLTCPQK